MMKYPTYSQQSLAKTTLFSFLCLLKCPISWDNVLPEYSMFRRKLPVRSRDFCLQSSVYQQSTWSWRNTKSGFRCDCTRLDLTGNTRKEQKRPSRSVLCHLSGTTHLVVPDDSDVRRRAAGAAVVSNVVVFGAGDPAGGEEERVELLAQGLPSHELDRQLPTDKEKHVCRHYVHQTWAQVDKFTAQFISKTTLSPYWSSEQSLSPPDCLIRAKEVTN